MAAARCDDGVKHAKHSVSIRRVMPGARQCSIGSANAASSGINIWSALRESSDNSWSDVWA
jgi:hypothetical protein